MQDLSTRWLGKPPRKSARAIVAPAVSLVYFLLSNLIQRWQAPPAPTEPVDIVIHTHVEPSALSQGPFEDRYTPGLEAFLRKQDLRTFTMPYLSSLGGLSRFWRTMRGSGYHPFCEKRYYKLTDYLNAAKEAYSFSRVTLTVDPICGISVETLFASEQKRTRLEVGTLEALLRTRLGRRLAEHGIRPLGVIMEFENMILERGLILGLRADLPDTVIIGYQHGTIPPNLLCNFVQPEEIGTAPIADRVVCNGKFFQELLIDEGLPEQMVSVGGALRYQHLHQRVSDNHPEQTVEANLVLVPLPLMLSDAVELLTKTIEAFGATESFRVTLKVHPFGSLAAVLDQCAVRALPMNFGVASESISCLLPKVGIVVGMASTTLAEAAVAGLPIISVARDVGLEFDHLAWTPELRTRARTPDEIRESATDIMRRSEAQRLSLRAHAQRYRDQFFAPISDESLKVFNPREVGPWGGI